MFFLPQLLPSPYLPNHVLSLSLKKNPKSKKQTELQDNNNNNNKKQNKNCTETNKHRICFVFANYFWSMGPVLESIVNMPSDIPLEKTVS